MNVGSPLTPDQRAAFKRLQAKYPFIEPGLTDPENASKLGVRSVFNSQGRNEARANAVLRRHANAMTSAQKNAAARKLQSGYNAEFALRGQESALGLKLTAKLRELDALYPTLTRADIIPVLVSADGNLEIAKKLLRKKILENKEKTVGLTNIEHEELYNPFGPGSRSLYTNSGSRRAVPPTTVTIPAGGAGSSTAYVGNSATPGFSFKPNLFTTPPYLIENPKWRAEAEVLQAKAKAEAELAQAVAKIPTTPVTRGGRSRRLKSKRNKRTRRHVR
jgi:hypothetical protein